MVFPGKIKINFFQCVFLFALAVYGITAWNSHGFFHADEHYQIIEFAGYKLGTHASTDLAWEFNAQIRPSIQPTLCFGVLKTLLAVGINDPYTQAFVLRLLSAILALLVITSFIKHTEYQFENSRVKKAYYLLSYFLWFIPFISVRFSSETWSGLLFLYALSLFMSNIKNDLKPILLGLVFGLSFLFRFQIVFAMAGFVLWLIVVHKINIYFLLKLFMGFVVIVFSGFILDYWFYGEMVFTPWNYFNINILENAASGFGTSPWYFYLVNLIRYPGYFIGIPLILSILVLLIAEWRNLYLWCLVFFILAHSLVSHKEERFIFPMVYLFPVILISGYVQMREIVKSRIAIRTLNFALAFMFITFNITGLVVIGQKAAGIGRTEITKYLHDNYKNQSINLIYCSWANPYNPWHGLPIKFYEEKNMTDRRIQNLCELNDSLITPGTENFLVIRKFDLKNRGCSKQIEQQQFIEVKQSIPEWIEYLNSKYRAFENSNILVLYKYTGDKK
ncbi:MAG: hypothetical protein JXJ22_03520 [Bacteroidales bacterium]|nr:hypothetical protein [Bacteroidales bacterium]